MPRTGLASLRTFHIESWTAKDCVNRSTTICLTRKSLLDPESCLNRVGVEMEWCSRAMSNNGAVIHPYSRVLRNDRQLVTDKIQGCIRYHSIHTENTPIHSDRPHGFHGLVNCIIYICSVYICICPKKNRKKGYNQDNLESRKWWYPTEKLKNQKTLVERVSIQVHMPKSWVHRFLSESIFNSYP